MTNTGRPSHDRFGGRARVALEVLDTSEARGFLIPHRRDGSVPYRGSGELDYACGGCGHLLAIGVPPGLFERFVFSCGCGALNRVPWARRGALLESSVYASAPGADVP
jgi:hypothetical protein